MSGGGLKKEREKGFFFGAVEEIRYAKILRHNSEEKGQGGDDTRGYPIYTRR